MGTRKILRVISLIMLVVAVVFVYIALHCPTCTVPKHVLGFRTTLDMWKTFYKGYVVVMALLFFASFFFKKNKKP